MASPSLLLTLASLLLLASITSQASASASTLAATTRALVASQQVLHISTISAAPAILPTSPVSSPLPFPPALPPDIEPLLPSPGGSGGSESPSESTLPIIPSSPSPPNPDDITAPQPEVAQAPSSSLPVSASKNPFPSKNVGSAAAALLLCSLSFFA